MKKALICVDVQYDFMPVSDEEYKNGMGGALAVKEADQIIPVINELLPKYDLVIFTKDWHLKNNIYFADSHPGKKPFDQMEIHGKIETLWPVHCVQNTRGADLHDDIDLNLIEGEYYIFKKGVHKYTHPYGGFGDSHEDTGLHDFLIEHEVKELDIVGLALDYCVKDTAVFGAKLGYKVNVISEGTKAIADDFTDTIVEFANEGVILTTISTLRD